MCLARSGEVSCPQGACWGEGSFPRWVLHHVLLCAHVRSDLWVIKYANLLLGLHALSGCCKWVLYCTVFNCWYCFVPCFVIWPSIGARWHSIIYA